MIIFLSNTDRKVCAEYIEGLSIDHHVEQQLLDKTIDITSISQPIIFINFVPELKLSFTPKKGSSWVIGILFIEQMTHDRRGNAFQALDKLVKIKTILSDKYDMNIHIIFFSNFQSVINEIQKEDVVKQNNITCFYLPYITTDIEMSYLQYILETSEKEYDVCFVGSINPRRQKIIDEIQSKGLSINIIQNKFSLERDTEIAKCKIFMCPHYCDDGFLYENIRFDRFLFQGMPILSEECSDTQLLDVKDFIIFKEYNQIADACCELVKQPFKRQSTFDDIIQKRKEHVHSIHTFLQNLISSSS
jgi:hypothetical protein